MDRIIEDKELGRLIVRNNVRAKQLVFRTKADAIYISVPPGVTAQEIKEAIEKLRPRLLYSKQKSVRPLIDLNYRIETECIRLSLISGKRKGFFVHEELGKIQIICSPTADFSDPNLQDWLRKVIEEILRRNAKAVLPSRLYALSKTHQLPYESVQINSSRGRWGSCSSRKKINLSYFLVLLPKHLIDYVLLHELCHTCEMNHGTRFWNLLNELTEGRAFELREEMKKYKTEI